MSIRTGCVALRLSLLLCDRVSARGIDERGDSADDDADSDRGEEQHSSGCEQYRNHAARS